jgi:hypothetical protein
VIVFGSILWEGGRRCYSGADWTAGSGWRSKGRAIGIGGNDSGQITHSKNDSRQKNDRDFEMDEFTTVVGASQGFEKQFEKEFTKWTRFDSRIDRPLQGRYAACPL